MPNPRLPFFGTDTLLLRLLALHWRIAKEQQGLLDYFLQLVSTKCCMTARGAWHAA